MAGHSKWNNIKNKKGAADAKRSALFTQLSVQIKTAVKEGHSADVAHNSLLRVAVDKARAANMPKEKINRALERGLGVSAAGAHLHEIVYEGFGPQGMGLLVAAVTGNPTRTSSEMKFIFSRAGGSLAGPGAVSYLFERQPSGEYRVVMPLEVSDDALQQKLDALVAALLENDDVEAVYTAWEAQSDSADAS